MGEISWVSTLYHVYGLPLTNFTCWRIFVVPSSHPTLCNSFSDVCYSWLIGPRPEFVDPKFVAQGEGRESMLNIYRVTVLTCTLIVLIIFYSYKN